jgi:S1-C subfamily serine protease
LGLYIQGLNDAQAKQLKLSSAEGVVITELKTDGPAYRAGLKIGDVLISLNDVPIGSAPQMQEQLSRYRPGQSLRIAYFRDGKKRTTTAVLQNKGEKVKALVSNSEEE